MADIILVDFAGTLVTAETIEEANVLRSRVLERALPTRAEHADPDSLYKANREYVEKLTGVSSEMKVLTREFDLETREISGLGFQNMLSTNLFQLGMLMVANKRKRDIFQPGILDSLQRVKGAGYRLAIFSGVRTDTISAMLSVAGCPFSFDHIICQPYGLGVSNNENLRALQKLGNVRFVIGDKLSDIEPAKRMGAKAVFVTWGHASGGEEEVADYTISDPAGLLEIIPLE